jgi:hypothetical protein
MKTPNRKTDIMMVMVMKEEHGRSLRGCFEKTVNRLALFLDNPYKSKNVKQN